MLKMCPLSVGRVNDCQGKCGGKYCVFTDEVGECLIKQALQCYVSESRTRQAKEQEFTRTYVGQPVDFGPPRIENHFLNI